jgi:signal transduction histidine kinase
VKSLFGRIVAWGAAIVIFSLAAIMVTSLIRARSPQRDDFFRRVTRLQAENAFDAYRQGGRAALQQYMAKLDRVFRARHYLLDRNGRDVLTGADRTDLLRATPRPRFGLLPPFRLIHPERSPDGQFIFAIDIPVRSDPLEELAAYGWIVLVVLVLCYVLAVTLARPIRALRETVVEFGRGKLDARAHFRRQDEIGDLANAFDEMAGRIQTLLDAERRLLQDVSHELRSPLSRLSFAVELARQKPGDEAAFARVKKEIDRISRLVAELIQVTRAEGDPATSNLEPIDLGEFLTALTADLQLEADAQQCRFQVAPAEPVVWNGDRELLHRAVENVMRNAVRFSPAGSVIEVELTAGPAEVVIGVRDYGPGVPEEMLAQIFRPFFRVEADRGRSQGGVGLGLAIAQRAVGVHHGSIEARNQNPGLRVEIRLPR